MELIVEFYNDVVPVWIEGLGFSVVFLWVMKGIGGNSNYGTFWNMNPVIGYVFIAQTFNAVKNCKWLKVILFRLK